MTPTFLTPKRSSAFLWLLFLLLPHLPLESWAAGPSAGRPRHLYHTRFDGTDNSLECAQGNCERRSEGLQLHPGAILRLRIPQATGQRNVRVRMVFESPAHPATILSSEANPCACALKLYMGRWVVDFAHERIALSRLDTSYARIESEKAWREVPARGEGQIVDLEFEVRDELAEVRISGVTYLRNVQATPYFDRFTLAASGLPFVLRSFSLESADPPALRISGDTVEIAAVFRPRGYFSSSGTPHHLVAQRGSASTGHALFLAEVTPQLLREALERAGNKPGAAPPRESWTLRRDAGSQAPRTRAQGPRIRIETVYAGKSRDVSETLPLRSETQADFRFSVHAAPTAPFVSGCLVCLHSCPVGIVSDHNRTMRDYARSRPRLGPRRDSSFGEGDKVVLRFVPGSPVVNNPPPPMRP